MRRPIFGSAAVCFALSVFSGASAAAQTYREASTGLTVAPPAGYSAQKLPANENYKQRVSVRRAGEAPETGCTVGFNPSNDFAMLSRAEINAQMRGTEILESARSGVGELWTARSTRHAQFGDVLGVEVVADRKRQPGVTPRAMSLRLWSAIMLNPKGTGGVICLEEQKKFARRKAEFESVARGVRFPG